MSDLAETSENSPEKISFQVIGNLLVLVVKILFNKRNKAIQFKLEKSKLSLEDSNKFLIRSNKDLRSKLKAKRKEIAEKKEEFRLKKIVLVGS